MKKDFYEILDLERGASSAEIKKAYRKKAIKFHPDKNQGSRKFEDKLKKITLAYSQLKMTIGKK